MRLTEEQKSVIRQVSKFDKKVYKIGGLAGTGKSVLVRNLMELFPNFAACAYTGKAANVLRKKGVWNATTIHSLIYKASEDDEGNVHFSLAGNIDYDGVIVDEASMVSEDIYKDLLSFGRPVIFVGDHGQLEPIGDKFNLMKEPDFTLEEIHRNAGEIAHFAEFVRKGYKPSSWQHRSGSSDKIKFLSKSVYKEMVTEVDQIICAFNKTRTEINRFVRQKMEMNADFPQIGDKVICLRNNSGKGIFNGMQGNIGWFYDKNFIQFVSEDHCVDISIDLNAFNQAKYEFDFDKDSPNPFDYAYAITCHKCQGDEFNKILVLEQKCDLWSHQRWAYTAASRAKEKIYWVY